MYTFLSNNELETKKFAKILASNLIKGDIIILSGDLGSGKTKFTEGILSYFGLENEISSPTFTIVNEYSSTPPIYHFDVYRLSDVEEFFEIGGEEYLQNGICIIEWGELIEKILPKNYLKISFSKSNTNDNIRILKFDTYGDRFNSYIANSLSTFKEDLK